jgi:predicted porin
LPVAEKRLKLQQNKESGVKGDQMGSGASRARLCAGASVYVLASLFGAAGVANAQSVSPDELRTLKAQIDALQAKVKDLESKTQQSDANASAAKRQASEAQAQAAAAKASASQASATAAKTQTQVANLPVKPTDKDDWFFRHKPGDPLTFQTPGGEITAYGQIDVSFDAASKTVTGFFSSFDNINCGGPGPPGGFCTPTGNFGWMPDISTNISYVGVRGFQRLSGFQPSGLPVKAEPVIEPASDWRFVYQLEAGFDVSAFPSNRQSNSNLSNQVNGALFSRNSYIGLANPLIGAIKIGKEDTPYKSSTAAFNPFSGEWGDYSVIMGNTGGDNRVEFGYRASHAIWYESPNMSGWQFNALYAPGQNRSWVSDNIASGESDCAGNNDPTSGGGGSAIPPFCTDGSFSDLVSANLSYTLGNFYATAAGEWHHATNRRGDIEGMFALPSGCQDPNGTPLTSQLCMQDVADEWAAKIGALYKFASTGTTVGAIVEYMKREVPADLAFQNERTRWGTWVFLSQTLTPVDSVHFGWAHAFRAQGDPCQHNDCTQIFPGATVPGTPPGPVAFATNQNQADMVTAAYKHQFSKNLTWYTDIAATFNGPSAHYDLGAGGRAVTTDCHDANEGGSAAGGITAAPTCFTGTTLVGVSTGLQWRF